MENQTRILFTIPLRATAFQRVLRERESLANAGSTSQEDKVTGWQVWSVGQDWIGLSHPKASEKFALLSLSEAQYQLIQTALATAVPQAELGDFLWEKLRVPRFDSYPLSHANASDLSKLLPLGSVLVSKVPALPVGTKVQLLPSFLSRCSEAEQKRMRGRIGEVTGYRMGAEAPIVDFPASGRRKALRWFEVNPASLQALAPSQP